MYVFKFVINRYLLATALLCCLISCNKEYSSIVKETSLTIEGRYDCISAEWLGIPIDINNDGVRSCNIIDEFMGLSNSLSSLGDNVMVLTGVENIGQRGCMAIRFPMQYIRENHSDKSLSFANPLGSTAWYEFYFSIDHKGNILWEDPISISNPTEYIQDEGHYCDGIDYLKTGPANVRYILDGTICITFNVTYYDWSSQSWASGKIEGRYKRRSPLSY